MKKIILNLGLFLLCLIGMIYFFIVFIEITQYFLQCGILDINDIIANTFGFVGGIFSYKLITNNLKDKFFMNSQS